MRPSPSCGLLFAICLMAVFSGCQRSSAPIDEPEHDAEPRSLEQITSNLKTCPVGDTVWREARDAAGRDPEKLARLEGQADELVETCAGRWEPLWLHGECLLRLQRGAESIERQEQGLELALAANDDVGVSCCGLRIADGLRKGGEPIEAKVEYERVLDASRRAGRRDLEGFALTNYARLLEGQGDPSAAIHALGQAAAIFEELGLDRYGISVSSNQATLRTKMGDASVIPRLVELHEHGLAQGNTRLADSTAIALGYMHRMRRDWSDAERWFGVVSRTAPRQALRADFGLGLVATYTGKHAQAQSLFETVAAKSEEPGLALIARAFAAKTQIELGNVSQASAALQEIVTESEAVGETRAMWISRWLLGRAHARSGREREAREQLAAAIAVLESQAAQLDRRGSGLGYLRERTEPYADLAAVFADSSAPDRSEQLLAIARSLNARSFHQEVLEIDTLQRALSEGEWVVSYILGEQSGVVLAISRTKVVARKIAGHEHLEGLVYAYRREMQRPLVVSGGAGSIEEDRAAGRELTRALVDPIAEILEAKTIYVAADRELALLPFAALPVKEGFLGDSIDVAVMAAAATPADWPVVNDVFLAGAPRFDRSSDYAELGWAAFELDRIAKTWDAGFESMLAGEKLSWSALKSRPLENYSLLHLATHAVASTRDPRRSGIVMSGGELIGIDQIETLSLEDMLVVLSACQTGEGEVIPGEGVVGLRWAFLQAGAAGVVASQWVVDDQASARLMIAFHRGLRTGVDPVRALAAARREIAAEHPHPAYWAPFEIVVAPR